MTPKSRCLGWNLLALLVGLLSMGPSAFPQEQAKRKVKERVVPVYPELARRMRFTGKVKIEVVIATDGRVKSTRAIGGHPLLVNSAVEALQKWRFQPGNEETTEVLEFEFKAPSSS